MKVLHIIPSLSARRGGATKAAIDMVAALRDEGVDAELACTNDDGPVELDLPLGELIEYAGVPVRFFKRYSPTGNNRISTAIREFAYSASFRQWLHKHIHNYDLLHVHALFSFTSSYCMYLARKRGIKYISHPIGSLERWSLSQSSMRKDFFLALVDKRNLQQASYVHFTAESEKEQAIEVVAGINPLVIPLGLKLPVLIADSRQQLRARYSVPQDSIVLLFLGRLHEKKGLEILLQALANLSHPRAYLLIAGDGNANYKKTLKTQVEQLGLIESVIFLGYVDGQDKDILIQAADLFALTSYSENFGIAALEAMAHGTAVLLSSDVALAKVVDSYDVGATCETTISSVQTCLNRLITDVDDLQQKGQQGRDYVSRHHHWPELANQLADAYAEVISG